MHISEGPFGCARLEPVGSEEVKPSFDDLDAAQALANKIIAVIELLRRI